MLAAQRQATIARLVQERGSVRVTDLVAQFGVSDMTIRRDLDALSSKETVTKVHGGAVRGAPRRTDEPKFESKTSQMTWAKRAIAERAAALVEPGMSIALSAGTTTWALAQQLADVQDLTVVTNSTRISDVFQDAERTDRTVILTGGIRTPSDALVGPTAVSALSSVHVDIAFLGAHGMSAQAGCTTPNYWEADTNRALIAAAQRCAVIADHSKWGVTGVMTFAELPEIDLLITDAGLAEDSVAALREQCHHVIVAAPGAQAPSPDSPGISD